MIRAFQFLGLPNGAYQLYKKIRNNKKNHKVEIQRSFFNNVSMAQLITIWAMFVHHPQYLILRKSDFRRVIFRPTMMCSRTDWLRSVCVCVSVCGKTATGTEPAKRALIRAQLHKQTFREICPRRCIARVDSRFDRIILAAARDWHVQSAEITGL